MPGRVIPFATDEVYHVFNRGVEKRETFRQPRDYQRFLQTVNYYRHGGRKPKFSTLNKTQFAIFNPSPNRLLVEILCYCLLPNHFHLLLRQKKDKGISIFLSQLCNSYTRYFNTKHKRVGALFQGTFKAVLIEDDQQLVHISRYIHLNPLLAKVTPQLDSYKWSSWSEYMSYTDGVCNTEEILGLFKSSADYRDFTKDQIDYAETLRMLKRQLLDLEDI